MGYWFHDDQSQHGSGSLGSRIGGHGSQNKKLKLKGKSGLGYSEVVDPVSPHRPMRADEQNVIDWDSFTIRGTSQKLEKSYLRLTSVSNS